MNSLLFVLFWLGIHTSVSLNIGLDAPLPYIISGLCALVVAPRLLTRAEGSDLKKIWPLLAYLALSMLVTWLTAVELYYMRSLRGVLQLIYSIGIAAAYYHVVFSMPRKTIAFISLSLLSLLAILSVLEVLGPTKDLSDNFRQSVSTEGSYMDDARDLALNGAIRAKVFALEPSHAATSVFVLSMAYLWATEISIAGLTWWALMVGIAGWAIRSPILLIAIVCGSVTMLLRPGKSEELMRLVRKNLLAPIMASLVSASVFFALTYMIFQERIMQTIEGEGSFSMRVEVPYTFTKEFLQTHLWMGVGVVGNLDMLTSEIVNVYHSLGMTWLQGDVASRSITNCVALHFIYFGAAAGIVAIFLLFLQVRQRSRILTALLCVQLLCIWFMMGGYNSAPLWVYCALLVAVVSKESGHMGPVPGGRVFGSPAQPSFQPEARGTITHPQ